jgi:hypothetical protein
MPIEFLRGVLGVLCVLFSHFAGRTAVAVKKGRLKLRRLYAWIIRAAVCGIAISLRHPTDTIDVMVWLLSLAAFASGWWDVSRERPTEDLTHEMFPK